MEYKYKYYFKPRHSDFDVYLVAHHSKYFCWFEEARYQLFSKIPDLYEQVITTFKLPVTDLACKYIKSVSTLDEYVVKVKAVFDFQKPIIHFDYRLMDKEEKVLYAKGFTEHVFLNHENKLIIMFPEEVKQIIEKLCIVQA